jgi:HAD superfamily hydrolase (TIGR01484 family)
MRIAASDYDGTLCIRGAIAPETIAAIRAWRAAGNAFGIVTGRDLSMLLPEIARWNIEFDFLVCATGAIVYDGTLSVLHRTDIADETVPRLLAHSAVRSSQHCALFADGTAYLHLNGTGSWYPKLHLPYTEVSLAEAARVRGVQQVSLTYPAAAEAEGHTRDLNAAFSGALHAYQNGWCIDIARAGISKATGLAELLAARAWPEEGLLAVGDGRNDLPMIRRFGGVTVTGADEEVRREARAEYASVGDMLRSAL